MQHIIIYILVEKPNLTLDELREEFSKSHTKHFKDIEIDLRLFYYFNYYIYSLYLLLLLLLLLLSDAVIYTWITVEADNCLVCNNKVILTKLKLPKVKILFIRLI